MGWDGGHDEAGDDTKWGVGGDLRVAVGPRGFVRTPRRSYTARCAPHPTHPPPTCEDVERERERERRGNVGVVPIAHPKNLPVWKETLVKVTSVCSRILMGLVNAEIDLVSLASVGWSTVSTLSSQSYSRQAL